MDIASPAPRGKEATERGGKTVLGGTGYFITPAPKEITLSNEDFFRTMFGDLRDGAYAWTCTFPGDAKKASGASWRGKLLQTFDEPLSRHDNNFVAISSHTSKRVEADVQGIHFMMLDDLGTKGVGLDQLPVAPSYVFETSSGNFQAGWRLENPASVDAQAYKRFIKAVLEAGWGDKDADSAVRYCRLPVGANAKAAVCQANGGKPFETVVREWEPMRVFTLSALAKAFSIEYEIALAAPQAPESAPDWQSRRRLDGEVMDDVVSALDAINDGDDREVWLKVGFALKSTDDDAAWYQIWIGRFYIYRWM